MIHVVAFRTSRHSANGFAPLLSAVVRGKLEGQTWLELEVQRFGESKRQGILPGRGLFKLMRLSISNNGHILQWIRDLIGRITRTYDEGIIGEISAGWFQGVV
jgi:hypothetical protein